MGERTRILVIDDDDAVCELLAATVNRMGHEASSAGNLRDGFDLLRAASFEVVLLDVMLPDGNGLEALPDFVAAASSPQVIVMTAAGKIEGAEMALRTGAWDYVCKPLPVAEIQLQIQRALLSRKAYLASRAPVDLKRTGIIGESHKMRHCLDLLARAAGSHANVLISGETGVGKEAFAQTIHENSQRAAGPFVIVDCSSLPENLAESILFGHERGSFTGAEQRKDGLVKTARGGTLFLDEVGELSLSMQKIFLRVLQERKYRPVGSLQEYPCDFRLIAATNRDLDGIVAGGTFREDLLFRLRTMQIVIPPLRERNGDLRRLTAYFLAQLEGHYHRGFKGISTETLQMLESYPWPGNIRELRSTLEYAYLSVGEHPTITQFHLPAEIRVEAKRRDFLKRGISLPGNGDRAEEESVPIHVYREMMEKKYLSGLMEKTGNDTVAASRLAGISRSRLYGLLQKHAVRW